MKLNLNNEGIDLSHKHNSDGPIRLWAVTTQSDDESTHNKPLGTHYGHIIEIALSLSTCAYNSLAFNAVEYDPSNVAHIDFKDYTPDNRPAYKASSDSAFVSYDIISEGVYTKRQFIEFIDCKDQVKIGRENYYHVIKVELIK